jgi:hypothetical protein
LFADDLNASAAGSRDPARIVGPDAFKLLALALLLGLTVVERHGRALIARAGFLSIEAANRLPKGCFFSLSLIL